MSSEAKVIGLKVGIDTGASALALTQVNASANALVNTLEKVDIGTNKSASGFLSLGTNISTLGGIIAGVGLGVFLREVTQAANDLDRANMGLASVARYAGEGIDETLAAAKRLTEDGLMPMSDAATSLKNLLSRGFGLDEAVQLMNRFKDSAAFGRQGSLQFGEAIRGATEGLKNEMSQLVDNAGVTKNVSIMWKEYAAQIGTTVDKMTMAQKRQAEYNGIMKETEAQIGNAALMANSFAGAQAKAAQQTTELKASLGVALQPALQAVLNILSPVVKGLRDMVYWVETLGARAAATYDKLKLRAEIAFSGKGVFSAEGLKEYAERSRAINAALDETINDIVKRSEGPTTPNIGADTGKRRSDTILPTKDSKAESLAKSWESAKISILATIAETKSGISDYDRAILEADKKADALLQKYGKVGGAKTLIEQMRAALKNQAAGDEADFDPEMETNYQNFLGNLTWQQQKQFDERSSDSYWQGQRQQEMNEERDATFAHNQTLAAYQHSLTQTILEETAKRTGDYKDRILDQYSYEKDEALNALNYTLEYTALTEAQAERLRAEYRAKRKVADKQLVVDLTANEEQLQQNRVNFASSATSTILSLTNSLVTLSGRHNKTMFLVNKAASSANAVVNTAEAVTRALKSASPPYNYVLAALVAAAGAAQIATIAQTSMDSSASTYNGGSGLSSGEGASSNAYSNATSAVTQPSTAPKDGTVNLTVRIDGNVISDNKWVEEMLAPTIRDLAQNRNVNFGFAAA